MNNILKKHSIGSDTKNRFFICGLLVAATLLVYWNVGNYDFNAMDDGNFVKGNDYVKKGITIENIVWAFDLGIGQKHKWYYHPLTWIFHMLDCQLFGIDAGMHHLSNLVLHILNAILLFIVLQKMTGALWKSAFVAMLFAVHPLNVESVAWIAEKKNLLSTFFWMLTMLAYVYYAEQPGIRRYLLVMLSLTLGLLSKTMLITLPCALLLLDFWPLARLDVLKINKNTIYSNDSRRFRQASPKRLFLEKIPLFILSGVFLFITIFSLRNGQVDCIVPTDFAPFSYRLASAPIGYIKYIYKLIWPHDLAIFYPMPIMITLEYSIFAGIALLFISGTAILNAKKRPYLIIGWLWFLGTLLPAIGFVQGGVWPEIADRWTYIPAIGLFILITWGSAAFFKLLPGRKVFTPLIATVIIVALMITCYRQVSLWSDNKKLFQHAYDVTENNFQANYVLGMIHADENNIEKAIFHLEKSTALIPASRAHGVLCEMYVNHGMIEKAVNHYTAALKKEPENITYLNALGDALVKQNKLDIALTYFERAMQIDPKSLDTLNNMGNVFISKNQYKTAMKYFSELLKHQPLHVEANINAGVALAHLNQVDSAITHYQTAIKQAPENAEAYNNLGVLLAGKKRFAEAEDCFQEAVRLRPDYSSARTNLDKLQPFLKKQQHPLDSL